MQIFAVNLCISLKNKTYILYNFIKNNIFFCKASSSIIKCCMYVCIYIYVYFLVHSIHAIPSFRLFLFNCFNICAQNKIQTNHFNIYIL